MHSLLRSVAYYPTPRDVARAHFGHYNRASHHCTVSVGFLRRGLLGLQERDAFSQPGNLDTPPHTLQPTTLSGITVFGMLQQHTEFIGPSY